MIGFNFLLRGLYNSESSGCWTLKKRAEKTVIERIWTLNNTNLKGDLVHAVSSHMDLDSLLTICELDELSRYSAGLVLSEKAKEFFPEFASVLGRIPTSKIKAYLQRVHSIAEDCGCPLSLFKQEKASPTFIGTRQLEEYLDLRSTLIVWQALADAIGVDTKPDLSNLKSLGDFRKQASQFKSWFNTHISQLRAHESLAICNKNLTSLPSEVYQLTHLKDLLLGSNHLKYLPDGIGNLTSLEHLHLQNNDLISLPDEVGNLASLKELDIEKNNLTSLPSIEQLTSLKELNLDDKLASEPNN